MAQLENNIEEYSSNCVVINGTITSDIINVGSGYYAFYLIGEDGSELPLILIKEKLKVGLIKNDKISAFGKLRKENNEWCVDIINITKILSDEEIDKLD